MSDDIWDDPEALEETSEEAQVLALAEVYVEQMKLANNAAGLARDARERIKAFIPGDFGEQRYEVSPGKAVVVTTGERLEWSDDKLGAIKDQHPIIQTKHTIPKAVWDKLTPTAQAPLLHALTRHLSPSKITIEDSTDGV